MRFKEVLTAYEENEFEQSDDGQNGIHVEVTQEEIPS